MSDLILSLCGEFHHEKLIPGYAAAFRRRGVEFVSTPVHQPLNIPLEEILDVCPHQPSWVFHFESGLPLLPEGLWLSPVPTVSFQVDTYAFTRNRIRWSSLFDHVAVFHPEYDRVFSRFGHQGAFLVPHAVRREFFDGPEPAREFDLGWVGQVAGSIYRRRAQWLPRLAREFRMNDWSRRHSLPEVADVYRRSRIVINFSRDDFPQDANLRVFEVLASGAVLITSLPTELAQLGFQEGIHFVGYHADSEILPLARKYLADESARMRIGSAARQKVLHEHTYDHRANQILCHLKKNANRRAPARSLPESRARLMALDFFSSHGIWKCSLNEYRKIVGRGLAETITGAVLLLKAWMRSRRIPSGEPK